MPLRPCSLAKMRNRERGTKVDTAHSVETTMSNPSPNPTGAAKLRASFKNAVIADECPVLLTISDVAARCGMTRHPVASLVAAGVIKIDACSLSGSPLFFEANLPSLRQACATRTVTPKKA